MRVSFTKPSLFLALLFLVSCAAPEQNTEINEATSGTDAHFTFDASLLQAGDIILKKGKGFVSNKIAEYLDEKIPFSHCAVVLHTDTDIVILHSVAKEINGKDGVQIAPIEELITDVDKQLFYVLRLKKTDAIPGILEKAAVLLSEKASFDYSFNHTEHTSIYCTELIYMLFQENCPADCFQTKRIQHRNILLTNPLINKRYFDIVFPN